MKYLFALGALVLIFSHLSPASAATFRSDDASSITDPIDGDTYINGQSVTVNAPIEGELFAIGRNVAINKRSARSTFVIGDNVRLDDGTGYNLYAAANTLTIQGAIDHDVYIFGQSITFEPNTQIRGSVYAYGNRLDLAGNISGDVFFNGQRLGSSATINGSLRANASTIQFTDGAIARDLIYQSNREALGLDKIMVGGKTERSTVRYATLQSNKDILRTWLLSFLTPLVVGAAIILILPKQLADVSHSLMKDWLHHLLYGLLIFLIAPVALLLLASSFVAWPLVVIGFMLYIVLIYLASIMGKIIFGQRLLQLMRISPAHWWLSLLVGTLVISLFVLVPYISWLVSLALFVGLTIPALSASLLWWRKRLS